MVAFAVSVLLGLPYVPVITATAGVLMAIPFFGPFVAWVPPVLVAFVSLPDATLAALVGMAIGWFVIMNVVQPRVMADAVGIPPIVVFASVLIGSKVAGVAGRHLRPPDRGRHQRRLHVLAAALADRPGQRRGPGGPAPGGARGSPVRVPREPDPAADASPE